MRPALEDDDVVITARTRRVSVGDIVIAEHPFKKSVDVVKRVVGIDRGGRCELRGDDPDESSDSRSFGAIPRESIKGKVTCRLKRSGTPPS